MKISRDDVRIALVTTGVLLYLCSPLRAAAPGAHNFLPAALSGFRDSLAYPNPAVGGQSPVIRVSIGLVDALDIVIYDASGRRVHGAALGATPTGLLGGEPYYDYAWTGRQASGIYFAAIHGKKRDGSVARTRVKFAVVR